MIPEDEDISYEMTVHKKRYEAVFYQAPVEPDSLAVRMFLSSRYTDEQIEHGTEELKTEMYSKALDYLLERKLKKPVWFMISEHSGKYYICMFYDNEYNRANGDDL